MGYSREELFNKAKQARTQNKIEAEDRKANGFGGENYEETVYTALALNQGKVFRIIGAPTLIRGLPTDPKESYISMMKADNGKKFRCIWPSRTENKDWFLWKIYDTVMKCRYSSEKDAKGNSIKIYDNFNTHPETFKRVAKNDSDNQYETGWKPKGFVNMNIIDRHDKKWHEENKHTKLLSKKASEMGDSGKFWFEPGIPTTAYNSIWDDVVEYSGDFQNYDVVLEKKKETPWYKAYHSLDDFKKIDKEALKVVVEGSLTEEELAYELYDLDKLFKITSYSKIQSKLGDFIKKVDIDFKKTFSDELEKLVVIEKAEKEARLAVQALEDEKTEDLKETKKPTEVKTDQDQDEASPEKKVRQTRKPKETVPETVLIDWEGLIDGSFNGTKYLGISKMTEEEKELVDSVNKDGSFKYVNKVDRDSILQNENSRFDSPETFHIDPLNGEEF